jgi:hypothetical protein
MTDLIDTKGYAKQQDEIDAAILKALENGGKTPYELAGILRQIGVGNAKSGDPVDLVYSTTGAIQRAAVNSLRSRGLIYDSWDTSTAAHRYERPFRFFLRSPGRPITSTGDDCGTRPKSEEITAPTEQI